MGQKRLNVARADVGFTSKVDAEMVLSQAVLVSSMVMPTICTIVQICMQIDGLIWLPSTTMAL